MLGSGKEESSLLGWFMERDLMSISILASGFVSSVGFKNNDRMFCRAPLVFLAAFDSVSCCTFVGFADDATDSG